MTPTPLSPESLTTHVCWYSLYLPGTPAPLGGGAGACSDRLLWVKVACLVSARAQSVPALVLGARGLKR